jgi:transcriptional regulator with XRE-family HTH domain
MRGTLRVIRRSKDITQKKAAAMLGISADTLSNYERGKYYPDVPVIDRIVKLYETRYEDIIFLLKNND